jgi:DHA2 family multidrug resistance protein
VLCGIAASIEQMVLFRLLQGVFGAGLVIFMDETGRRTQLRFDWTGFLALSVAIGSMQLMFDRGEQQGWFDSSEIIVEAVIAAAGFYYFFAHSLTTRDPFVRFELFRDRNFAGGCFFMLVLGLIVFSTMALSTLFLQNVIGYPVLPAGLLMAARGVGTMVGMIIVGKLLKYLEARTLMFIGMTLCAITMHEMVGFTNMTSERTIIWVTVIQGFGLGLVFVPLSTAAFATLPGHLRTEGAAILTLVRNIGTSVGIPMVISVLVHSTNINHALFAERVTPFNDALRMPDVARSFDLTTDAGRALFDNYITLQSTLIGFANSFKLLMILALVAIPLLVIVGSSNSLRRKAPARASAPHIAE